MSRRRASPLSELSDETIDGIVFGLRLASTPGWLARRDAFWESVRRDKEALKAVDKPTLIAVLKQMNPAYIVDLLEQKTPEDLRDRVAHSMRGKNRPEWLAALGIEDPNT